MDHVDSISFLGVLIVHHKSLAKCLHYEPRLLAAYLLGGWVPMLGISSEISSHEVISNVSSVLSGGGTPDLMRDLDAT